MWTSRHRRPGTFGSADALERRPAPAPARMRSRRTRRAAARVVAGVVLTGLALVVAGCNRTPERSTDAFCQRVTAVQGLDQVLAGTDAGQATQQVEQLRALDEAAPSDIEPSVARLVGVADELAHALGTTKDPEAAADEVFRRHQDDFETITAAGAAVERYALDRCGVRLNPTGTTPLGTGAPDVSPTVTTSTTR